MQNKAKPFVKWVGGKSQLISAIEQILPKNFSKSKITYIEPFVGGGAVFSDNAKLSEHQSCYY